MVAASRRQAWWRGRLLCAVAWVAASSERLRGRRRHPGDGVLRGAVAVQVDDESVRLEMEKGGKRRPRGG